ncbi:hypothetical protein WUBG_09987, partial [Wuchereria bancrofti]
KDGELAKEGSYHAETIGLTVPDFLDLKLFPSLAYKLASVKYHLDELSNSHLDHRSDIRAVVNGRLEWTGPSDRQAKGHPPIHSLIHSYYVSKSISPPLYIVSIDGPLNRLANALNSSTVEWRIFAN